MPAKKTDKETIISKAYLEFLTKGYNNTSMSDIANACGIFKSGLYHHFKNKEDVMKEVLLCCAKKRRETILADLTDKDIPAQTRFENYIKTTQESFLASPSGCIFGNITLEMSNHNENLRQIIQDSFEEWVQALSALYQEKYDAKQAEDLARKTVSEIQGAIIIARAYKNPSHMKETLKGIQSYF